MFLKNEAFKEEGQFSIQKVDTFARQNGFLPGKYLESIRDDIALNFWRVGLSDSYFITSNELNHNIKLANQTRDITFLKLDKSEMEEDLEAAKENVLDFYNQNPSLFKTEEKAKIRFIQISLEDLGNIESISKEDVEQEYQAYLETFDSTIRRYASHLMINITIERHKQDAISLANDLRKKLESGENFESLIKEYSEDGNAVFSDVTIAATAVTNTPVKCLDALFIKRLLDKYTEQFLPDVPELDYKKIDVRNSIKTIKDFYSTKGTSYSISYLFKYYI